MTDLDAILQQLKRGLEDLYGPRLRGLYLFGSHARGEADEDSDIDVAVVLDDYPPDAWGEVLTECSALLSELCLEHGCLIQIVPFTEREWLGRRGALPALVRREGVPLT